MMQLRRFAEHKAEFDRLHAQIVAISVDDQEHARLVYDKQVQGKFPILSDAGAKVIREYGLLHPHGHFDDDIAIRATLVLDRDGIERWRYPATSVPDIPSPDEVLAQLRALK
jgi:peroxiredoxin